MKIDKIQVEILKELLKPSARVAYWEDNNGEIVTIIPTGTVGYVLPISLLRVNLEGAQTCVPLRDKVANPAQAVQLEPTDHYRRGGQVREYRAFGDEDKPVYVDTKLLANFENPQLFQPRYSAIGLVTVAEYRLDTERLEVCGIVCPVCIKDDED